jgi:hypothetical protein
MNSKYHLALEMNRILKFSFIPRKLLCPSSMIKTAIIGTFFILYCSYFDINNINSIERKHLLLPIEVIKTFANHGKEVSLELNSASFAPLSSSPGNQVKVGVNYTTINNTLIGNTINAVMKVYAINTTAIKSTSFPNGFNATRSGLEEIKTTIIGNSTQNIIAVVQFTDLTRTMPISNPLQIKLNLTQEQATATVTEEEPTYEIAALLP